MLPKILSIVLGEVRMPRSQPTDSKPNMFKGPYFRITFTLSSIIWKTFTILDYSVLAPHKIVGCHGVV